MSRLIWITGDQLSAIRRAKRALKDTRSKNYRSYSNVSSEQNERRRRDGEREIDLEVARIQQVLDAVDVARGVADPKKEK